LQSRYVVWLTKLIGDVLGVDDAVVSIKHKDGSCELSPLLDPHPIVLPELLTAMGREDLVQNACGVLPTSLQLWRVPTHGIDARIGWQRCAQSLPPSRHSLADRALQAVHHVEQTDHSCRVSQGNRADGHIRQIQVIQTEVGGPIAWVQLPAHDRELLSASEGRASAFFHDGVLPVCCVSTASFCSQV